MLLKFRNAVIQTDEVLAVKEGSVLFKNGKNIPFDKAVTDEFARQIGTVEEYKGLADSLLSSDPRLKSLSALLKSPGVLPGGQGDGLGAERS